MEEESWRPDGSIHLSRPNDKPFFGQRERKGDSPQALAQLFWWSGMGAACTKERLKKLWELSLFQKWKERL